MPGAPAHLACVLVVDDDDDLRSTLEELLEQEGYRAVGAANGVEALRLLRTLRPRLILLDVSMPVLGAAGFRDRQLADPALAAIPTVAMTGAGQLQETLGALRLTEALRKPFHVQAVLDLVERYVLGDEGAAQRSPFDPR
jgi:CheY-like chemotaxis protein